MKSTTHFSGGLYSEVWGIPLAHLFIWHYVQEIELGATRYMQWQEVHMASRSERSLRDTLAMVPGLTPSSHPRTQWYWRRGPVVMRNGMSDGCTQSPEIHL